MQVKGTIAPPGPPGRHGAVRQAWREASRDWGGRLVLGLVVYMLVYLAWQVYGWGGAERRTLISDLAFLPVSLIAAVLAWRAARQQTLDAKARRAWVILGVAFLAYWIGDCLFTYYENATAEAPFPSSADAAYIAFYPLLLWGVLSFPTLRRSVSDMVKIWLDTGTVLVGGYMLLWYFVLGPTAEQTEASPFAALVSVAYPIGDLVLVFAITAILLRRPTRSSGNALGVLAMGLILFVVADVAYAYLELNDGYAGGHWVDSLWMVAQVLMAVSAYVQYWRASHVDGLEPEVDLTLRTFSPLPYIVILGSFVLLAVVGHDVASYPLGGLLLGAIAITALVVARQIATLRENTRLVRELHELATTDSLTGLRSRRHFFEVAEREFYRSRRYAHPLTAMMMDIDFFKQINDTHGHATGDQVLEEIAYRCRVSLRLSDLVGRYGGDELVILLPDTGLEAALGTAARIRSTVDGAPVDTETGPIAVSISIGVASAEGCGDLSELLRHADEALYQAKQDGRNCTRALSA